jgi:hypothetical protein
MNTTDDQADVVDTIVRRAEERFQAHRDQIFRTTDRLFAWVMAGQWIFGILVALTFFLYA